MSYCLSETSSFLSFLQQEALKYSSNHKMQTIFTHYIIVVFYSEIEGIISNIIEDKIARGRNDEVAQYISNAVGRHRHNNKIQNIIDNFKGANTYKNTFLQKFNTPFTKNNNILHQQPITYFNECIEARHSIAHFSTSKTYKSWNDIQNIVDIGEYVLNTFANFIK